MKVSVNKEVLSEGSNDSIGIEHIQRLVARSCGVTVEEMLSRDRTAALTDARQIAMYIARENLKLTVNQIAAAFNKKDHTTVLYACRRIEEMIKTNLKIKMIVDNVQEKTPQVELSVNNEKLLENSNYSIGIEHIQRLVAESCGITVEEMLSSRNRTADLADARQIAMYIARENLKLTVNQIAAAFNKKDHTTVLYACRRIEEVIKTNLKVKAIVDNVHEKIQQIELSANKVT
jgi:chromosomal replication initiation ATPase DnaA